MKVRTKSILGSVHTRTRSSFHGRGADCRQFRRSPQRREIARDRHGHGQRTFYVGPLRSLGQRHAVRRRPDRDRLPRRRKLHCATASKFNWASASSASVNENHLTLTKGVGQVAAPESYEVSAGDLSIRSAAGNSRVRVAWLAGGNLEVTALSGAARVANRTGLVLASVPAGRQMTFGMQAAAAGVVTRTGCLLSKDGRFLIQDQNTQEVVEVRGDNLATNVGNRVAATGTVSALRPAIAIATSVLNANAVTLQQSGGCLSVAAALDAQTEAPTVAATPNQPAAAPGQAPTTTAAKTGMSTGAKVAIVAVVAGGGAGAAIALAGGKKSTSP